MTAGYARHVVGDWEPRVWVPPVAEFPTHLILTQIPVYRDKRAGRMLHPNEPLQQVDEILTQLLEAERARRN